MDRARVLTLAPEAVIDARGNIAFGAYAGRAGRVDRSAVDRGVLWRSLHWKRWHYAWLAADEVFASMAIVDLGWSGAATACILDREQGRLLVNRTYLGLPRLASHVAERTTGGARSTFRGMTASLRLERVDDTWRAFARGRGFVLEATLHETESSSTLCAVAPLEEGVANCTHKTPCLEAEGLVRVGGRRILIRGGVASMDHTNGLVARATRWQWASASGRDVAFNLVEGFNGPVENVVWIAGQIHPVGEATFTFDRATTLSPWEIRTVDGSVDVTFTPEERAENKNLGFAVSRYVQPMGTLRGMVLNRRVEDLAGVTEDHEARW